MAYHLNEKGEPGLCRAQKSNCPYGSSAMHYTSTEEARTAYEDLQGSPFLENSLSLSQGQWVRKSQVGVSGFLRSVAAKAGENNRFEGSVDELAELTRANLYNAEPGTGSKDGDVLLVRLPADGFYTNVVEVTDENRHLLTDLTEARVEGEAPVTKQILSGVPLAPARVVKIVVYRADVLAQDDDRTTQDEWEIVAILAQPEETVPMHPTTMERNASSSAGGTKRSYTDEQWAEARSYWANHAYADKD